MNKRIFSTMCLVIALSMLLFSAMFALVFFGGFSEQIKHSLSTLRVTMIDEAGTVIFDNTANTGLLENHLDRPEVAEALQNGEGESERYSNTQGEIIYYYAKTMPNGSVLRLAMTARSLRALLQQFVPMVLGCLLAAALIAFLVGRRLTRKIIAPINSIDLDKPELCDYEELLPLTMRIEAQNRQIAAQLEKLNDRTATISAITDNMLEGVLMTDEKGNIILANGSLLEILNKPQAVGKRIIEVCRDVEVIKAARDCLGGRKTETSLRMFEHIYNVMFSPVHEGERVTGVVGLFIDVSDSYAAETQRKEFSANVSHELKTPLTTIAALSEMISNGTAKEKDVRLFAEKIKLQSERLINIIDDIIKLSEFDEGGIAKQFTHFNLFEMAQSVVSNLAEKAAERDITVELRGEEELHIFANMRMMDELLYNLVDNAIKYNRDGGSVVISLTQDENETRLSVADTGIGIAEEDSGRVFERFYRVDKSRSKKTGGTGLGLSIVKHAADFHGAKLELKSRQGEGSTFLVRMPDCH